MAISVSKTVPKVERKAGRKTDPAVVEAGEAVLAGSVIRCTGDEKLTGKEREASAKSEAQKIYNFLMNHRTEQAKGKLTTVYSETEQAAYIGLRSVIRPAKAA